MPEPVAMPVTTANQDATFQIPSAANALSAHAHGSSLAAPSITILPGLQATLTIRLAADLVLPAEDQAQVFGKPLAEYLEEIINEQIRLYLGC